MGTCCFIVLFTMRSCFSQNSARARSDRTQVNNATTEIQNMMTPMQMILRLLVTDIDVVILAPSQLIRTRRSPNSCSSRSCSTVDPPSTPPATRRRACGRLTAETQNFAKIAITCVVALRRCCTARSPWAPEIAEFRLLWVAISFCRGPRVWVVGSVHTWVASRQVSFKTVPFRRSISP